MKNNTERGLSIKDGTVNPILRDYPFLVTSIPTRNGQSIPECSKLCNNFKSLNLREDSKV